MAANGRRVASATFTSLLMSLFIIAAVLLMHDAISSSSASSPVLPDHHHYTISRLFCLLAFSWTCIIYQGRILVPRYDESALEN